MEFYNKYYDDNMDHENRNKFNNSHRHDKKRNCCMKRVEETFCCYPSYYNEEKEDKKEEHFYPCYEGTFTLCPIKSSCNKSEEIKHNKCSNNNDGQENNDNRYFRNRCCFCRLFSRW